MVRGLLFDETVKCDILGGYRLVNFAIDTQNGAGIVATDVKREGSFLGVSFTC